MDRIALSKRIGGLADVFATGSPIRRELEAMSYALEHMQDEKFASILNEGYEADDKEAWSMQFPSPHSSRTLDKRDERIRNMTVSKRKQLTEQDIAYLDQLDPQAVMQALKSQPAAPAPAGAAPKMAGDDSSVVSGSWNREASDAVIRNLVSDVMGREAVNKTQCCSTGRKLEKPQMPDAMKKQETPPTLTEAQTPKLSESLDSGMLEKSRGAVRKEAAKDEVPVDEPKVVEPKEEPADSEKSVAQEKATERKDRKVKKTEEKARDTAQETADALKELDQMTKKTASSVSDASMIMFEDIELMAPMEEVNLSAEDARILGQLFR